MSTTTVTSKGQIVIPSAIRKKMNIRKGTKLLVEEREREIVLRLITPAHFESVAGALPTGGKLTKALLEERAKNRERERRR